MIIILKLTSYHGKSASVILNISTDIGDVRLADDFASSVYHPEAKTLLTNQSEAEPEPELL